MPWAIVTFPHLLRSISVDHIQAIRLWLLISCCTDIYTPASTARSDLTQHTHSCPHGRYFKFVLTHTSRKDRAAQHPFCLLLTTSHSLIYMQRLSPQDPNIAVWPQFCVGGPLTLTVQRQAFSLTGVSPASPSDVRGRRAYLRG